MNFLVEQFDELKCITEGSTPTEKKYYIEGIFIQSNIKNRNGRIYPKPIIENNLNNYQKTIESKRSLGELGHPATPTLNLDKASHIIESLKFDGDNVIGRARILPRLPMGKIAMGLIDEGVKLGVSTRGVGTVKNSIVQNDFMLGAIDIVHEPSAPEAWMTAIMENKEWVLENGLLVERTKDELNNTFKNKLSKEERDQRILSIFNKYISNL